MACGYWYYHLESFENRRRERKSGPFGTKAQESTDTDTECEKQHRHCRIGNYEDKTARRVSTYTGETINTNNTQGLGEQDSFFWRREEILVVWSGRNARVVNLVEMLELGCKVWKLIISSILQKTTVIMKFGALETSLQSVSQHLEAKSANRSRKIDSSTSVKARRELWRSKKRRWKAEGREGKVRRKGNTEADEDEQRQLIRHWRKAEDEKRETHFEVISQSTFWSIVRCFDRWITNLDDSGT